MLVRNQWKQQAQNLIAEIEKSKSKKMPIQRNAIINSAYKELYQSNTEIFKWAGLAEYASKSIGDKMKLLIFGTYFKSFGKINLANYLFEKVAEGNKAIFEDIYWQHLAYRTGGIAEMYRLFLLGELPETLYHTWQKLDKGRKIGNQDLIWQANTELLEYEQKCVIQPILYDGAFNRSLWRLISLGDLPFGVLIGSPVPEDKGAFRNCLPLGNLAIFEERWYWCVKTIMPMWRAYEQQSKQAPQPLKFKQPIREKLLVA